MEDIFSSKSSEIIERRVDVDANNNRPPRLPSDAELDAYFDVDAAAAWVSGGAYKRVALQFPDELLHCSIRVMRRLKASCTADSVQFFLLADTSYGSCCVDAVAAEHNSADALIHYGHSCLSQVDKLPVFYVFDKLELDVERLAQQAGDLLARNSTEQRLIVLYDVAYCHLYGT